MELGSESGFQSGNNGRPFRRAQWEGLEEVGEIRGNGGRQFQAGLSWEGCSEAEDVCAVFLDILGVNCLTGCLGSRQVEPSVGFQWNQRSGIRDPQPTALIVVSLDEAEIGIIQQDG